jgi:hypothetical protein
MKSQIVFEVVAEGGSLHIERQRSFNKEIFIYHHNEMDASDQGLEVSNNGEYTTFEEAFQLIHTKYEWYLLHLSNVHEDYRKYVADEMIKSFIFLDITLEDIEYSHRDLERALKIRLRYSDMFLHNGLQNISVRTLYELTENDYMEFEDEYSQEIGIKFKLRGSYKTWTDEKVFYTENMEILTHDKNFKTIGRLEVNGNTLVIKDKYGDIEYAFPSDKFFVVTRPISSNVPIWHYKNYEE